MNMLFPRGAGDVVSEPLPSPVIPTDPGVINPAVPPPAPVAPGTCCCTSSDTIPGSSSGSGSGTRSTTARCTCQHS